MPASLRSYPNQIVPALVTPLTPAGELDTASCERLIDHLYRTGVGGLYVTGSTGEGIYLDFATRRRLVEVAAAASRDRGQLLVHVGAVQAAEAIELARHAGRNGAVAVSSIPPSLGGFSWEEVVAFYRELAAASPVPVIAYYFPRLTGQTFSIDQLMTLLRLPNVGGVKFTDSNFFLMERLVAHVRDDQIVYNGPDEMLALGLMAGAHGGIGMTYNFMPELVLQVRDHCAAGKFPAAMAVQRQMNAIIEIISSYQGLAATKQILYWQGLIATPRCAAPRAPLNAADQAALRERLAGTAIAGSLRQ